MSADLFQWSEEEDARRAAAQAEAERMAALRRAHYAPHGKIGERRKAAQAATLDALKAEVALDKVRGGETEH